MDRTPLAMVVLACTAALAWAAPPQEADVQGMYEGTWKAGGGEGKLEARVMALGKQAYKAFVIRHLNDKKTEKAELNGKTDGDLVTFQGETWKGGYADGAIAGTLGEGGSFELKRYVPKSPAIGKKPPEGAVILIDGKNFDNVERRKQKDGSVPEWEIGDDGSVRVPRRGMSSKTRVEGSFDLHVEFLVPLRPDKRGQGRGNSGVYLPCGEEIQVLDSFGNTTYPGGGCGGLYRWKTPDTFDNFSLACYPPLTWQTFDIEYRVRQDDGGRPATFVTVHHNGIKIHDNVKLRRKPRKGGFHFQDHGNPVRYRNIWLLPVKDK